MATRKLRVLPQVDNFSCGYHSLKIALVLLQDQVEDATNRLCDKIFFWSFFRECITILDLIPHLPDKDILHEGVLEPGFARQLLISHPKLSEYEKSGQLSLFPALACLESGLLVEDDIAQLKQRLTRFCESKEGTKHVWVVSSNVHHWIALQAEKQKGGEVQFSIGDSTHSCAPLHPDVENLMRCLRGEVTFEGIYLEAIIRGGIKEFQETIGRCENSTQVDEDLLSESIFATRQLFRQLSEHLQSLYEKSLPRSRVHEKLAEWNQFVLARYGEKCTSSFGLKIKESFRNFRDATAKLIDWSALTREPAVGEVWPYMQASSFGDIVAQRNSALSKEYLSLWNFQLPSLPSATLSLANTLQSLNLSQNTLTCVPDVLFSSFPHLRMLSVSSNKISVFPEIASVCSSLEELRLGSNQLTTLPSSISNLCNLKELIVDSNRLTELPQLLPLTLRTVDLSRNRLTELSIENLTCLEALLIDHNKLQKVLLPPKLILQVLWSDSNPRTGDDLLASAHVTVIGYCKK